jgi:hypothetical protein
MEMLALASMMLTLTLCTPAVAADALMDTAQEQDGLLTETHPRNTVPAPAPRLGRASTVLDWEVFSDPARLEFVGFQTLLGISRGLQTAVILDLRKPPMYVASAMVGGGAALGLSLRTSTGGISHGRALMLNYGAVWGGLHGWAASELVGADQPRTVLGMVGAGQTFGLAASALAWHLLRPSADEVALMISVGMWSSLFTALSADAFDRASETHGLRVAAVMVMGNAGIVAGAVAAPLVGMSRRQLAIVDTFGLAGGVSFALFSILLESRGVIVPGVMNAALAGAVGGLGLGIVATRADLLGPERNARLTVSRLEDGAAVGVSGRF